MTRQQRFLIGNASLVSATLIKALLWLAGELATSTAS
ncbi:MAG: hypothetical protein BMS9Abin28_0137 [Anaerolineae bacterium]|nr:MAG: hypothetical protein BMS9Abin28_0137 [Anaerolineae bacterium]